MPAANGWPWNMPSSLLSDNVNDERLRLIASSYQRWTSKALLREQPSTADALHRMLWDAPFAIVAHGTEPDPIFFYGNRYALECFGMSFEEFTRLPSRLSAEPLAQQAREKLLQRVAQQGFVEGYSGMRIASDGTRFSIADCTVWNLFDQSGTYHGQAAAFIKRDN